MRRRATERPHGPDPRTAALARLAAAVALGATPASYQRFVDEARAAGANEDDLVGTVHAVASIVGVPRIVAAAPGLALALGYDVDAAFEEADGP